MHALHEGLQPMPGRPVTFRSEGVRRLAFGLRIRLFCGMSVHVRQSQGVGKVAAVCHVFTLTVGNDRWRQLLILEDAGAAAGVALSAHIVDTLPPNYL